MSEDWLVLVGVEQLKDLVCRNCGYPYSEPVKALGGNACDNFQPDERAALAMLMEGQPDAPRPLPRVEQILRTAIASNQDSKPEDA